MSNQVSLCSELIVGRQQRASQMHVCPSATTILPCVMPMPYLYKQWEQMGKGHPHIPSCVGNPKTQAVTATLPSCPLHVANGPTPEQAALSSAG